MTQLADEAVRRLDVETYAFTRGHSTNRVGILDEYQRLPRISFTSHGHIQEA